MLLIDTCSLLNLVKFYLPFDADKVLFNTVKDGVESGEFVIIDKVYRQCTWTSKGIVAETFPFLKENQKKTTDLLPDRNFFHYLDNDFKSEHGRRLTAEEFEVQKRKFLDDADANMLLYCISNRNLVIEPRILTDETGTNNDSKYFKKLPTLCETLQIGCLDLPTFLREHDGLNVSIR